MDAIFHRTSVRQFEDKSVENEKIELLLRAGMQAPSAANQQPWEFYVVRNKEVIEALSKTSPYGGPVANAPLAFVIAFRDGTRAPSYRDIDCAIATENIMLEADSLGLGSVMIGTSPQQERMDAVRDVLELPENLHAFTIIAIGYPTKVNPQQDRYDEARVHYID